MESGMNIKAREGDWVEWAKCQIHEAKNLLSYFRSLENVSFQLTFQHNFQATVVAVWFIIYITSSKIVLWKIIMRHATYFSNVYTCMQ